MAARNDLQTIGRSAFGRLGDGSEVERVVLAGQGLRLAVLSYGSVIQHLIVDTTDGPRPVTLGLESLDDYVRYSPHFGAIAGRFANRIRDGVFSLDGRSYQLTRNENGRTSLHGGARGFGKRGWTVEEVTDDMVRLGLVSPDGDEGYPGRLTAHCTYRLVAPLTLAIELVATSDAPTIVNLAAHSYFNLAGQGDIRDHRVQLFCDRYLPVDADLIPTGEIRPVADSPFDFRHMRQVQPAGQPVTRYDHTFVAGLVESDTPRRMARVEAPDGALALEVWSAEPGVQFYDGGKVAVPVAGTGGRQFGAFAGLCLEPQRFPNSPNQPGFTNAVLRPGDTYRQLTEYRFSIGGRA